MNQEIIPAGQPTLQIGDLIVTKFGMGYLVWELVRISNSDRDQIGERWFVGEQRLTKSGNKPKKKDGVYPTKRFNELWYRNNTNTVHRMYSRRVGMKMEDFIEGLREKYEKYREFFISHFNRMNNNA